MKPLFTIHEGEFLVGDHINRRMGREYDVWVPTKDTGVDLLVTSRERRGASVGLQVKFSRSFIERDALSRRMIAASLKEELRRRLVATSWFTLNPEKIRESRADLWVFAILTLRHTKHFVVIPTGELRKRIPRGPGIKWNVYLWVFDDGTCYQVRDLGKEKTLAILPRGVADRKRDFSEFLENWGLLDELTKEAR